MNPKTKYWLEDNKDKLLIGGATLALCGVALGGWMWFNRSEQDYQTGETTEVTIADYILTQRKDGDLETLSIETNKPAATLDLESDAIVFKGDNLESLYVYDNESVHSVSVDGDGEMSLTDSVSMPEMEGVQSVSTNGDMYGFLTAEQLFVVDDTGNSELVFEEPQTDVYQLGENGVYLAVNNEIHFVDYAEGKTQYIDMGDTTTRFSKHGDTIVARNDFGSGEDVETVLSIDDGSLFISDVKRMPHAGKVDVQVPTSDNQLVYIQTRTDEDQNITRQDLATIAIDAELDSEENIDLSDFTLPMDTLEPFAPYKSMAVRGFLYDWTDTGIRVIEMRNGREVTRVASDSKGPQLFVPVYLEQ